MKPQSSESQLSFHDVWYKYAKGHYRARRNLSEISGKDATNIYRDSKKAFDVLTQACLVAKHSLESAQARQAVEQALEISEYSDSLMKGFEYACTKFNRPTQTRPRSHVPLPFPEQRTLKAAS